MDSWTKSLLNAGLKEYGAKVKPRGIEAAPDSAWAAMTERQRRAAIDSIALGVILAQAMSEYTPAQELAWGILKAVKELDD